MRQSGGVCGHARHFPEDFSGRVALPQLTHLSLRRKVNEQKSRWCPRGPHLGVTEGEPALPAAHVPHGLRRCEGASEPGRGLPGARGGGSRGEEEESKGLASVNGPRGPREQEAAPAKTLTEKLLSKQRWPGRWIPSTIVRGADPKPAVPGQPLYSPRPNQTRSDFQHGLRGVTRSLAAQRATPPEPPQPDPGATPKAQALFLE